MHVEKTKYEATRQNGVHSQMNAELRAVVYDNLLRREESAEPAGADSL